MSNTSYAAQAVAAGPQTLAPPSFNGNGVLVALNLGVFTAGFFIMLAVAVTLSGQIYRRARGTDGRPPDRWNHPVTIWRGIGLLVASAGVIRFGFAAATLWGWNPLNPAYTGWLLTLQRVFDPIAAVLGLIAISMFVLSERGMVEQLRKEPFPLNMWASLPMLKRPAIIVLLSFACAIGVVSTR